MSALLAYRKQLGDVLLLQPTLARLATEHQEAVRLHTRPGFEPLLALMDVRPVPLLKPALADRFYAFEPKPTASLRAMLTCCARRTLCLTRAERVRPAHRWLYDEVRIAGNPDRYRSLVLWELTGGRTEDFSPPRLLRPHESWRPALPELPPPGGYLLIHPSAAWEEKAWPASRWIQVLKQWRRRWDLPIVITGGAQPWELALCARIADGLGEGVLALAGKTDLRGYLHLIANSALVACIDGSAGHLASAFGRPVVILFGPTNPVHWHWPGECSRRLWAADYCQERKPPLDRLPAEAVGQALDDLTGIAG